MKRIEPGDGQPTEPVSQSPERISEVTASIRIPGLMYRGVPQDRRRMEFRIDSVASIAATVTGPIWLKQRRAHSDPTLAELFYG